MFRMGKPVPGRELSKLSEPMWILFFELHTGPWRTPSHDKRPDTRPIEAPSRKSSRRITLQYRGHPHTPRDCWRLQLLRGWSDDGQDDEQVFA